MVTVDPDFVWKHRRSRTLTWLVAKDEASGEVVGVVMGVDHVHAFRDPDFGTSLWSLAVDPQSAPPGVGEALVRRLAERFQGRGRAFMDLSVMHDNEGAVGLYEKAGVPAGAGVHRQAAQRSEREAVHRPAGGGRGVSTPTPSF